MLQADHKKSCLLKAFFRSSKCHDVATPSKVGQVDMKERLTMTNFRRVGWAGENFKAHGTITHVNTSTVPTTYTVSAGSGSFETARDILFSEAADAIAEGDLNDWLSSHDD